MQCLYCNAYFVSVGRKKLQNGLLLLYISNSVVLKLISILLSGFTNILKQLSLIWLRRKLGSMVKRQHFLWFPDSSVHQINQHFLSSFLCWTLLKKGYIFRILSTLANASVYFWLIVLSKTSLLGQIFFLAKLPWPLRGENSFKQKHIFTYASLYWLCWANLLCKL